VNAYHPSDENKMSVNLITAKCEAIFPYDILMGEKVSGALSYEMRELGEVVIHAPELADINKLKEGHYGSRLRIDVTLDINKKSAELPLDRFFTEKCLSVLSAFLIEVWSYTKAPEIDPHLRPIFFKCRYYDSTGSPYINPDTGQSSYEKQLPRGLVLSKDTWDEVAANLLAGKRRDLAEIALLNARCMQDLNRPEIAILLAAITCEYKVKHTCDLLAKKKKVPVKVWNAVVDKLRPTFREYQEIMRSLGITSMRSSSDPKIKALPHRLDELFKHRNQIAHRGSIQGYKGKQFAAKQVFSLAKADIETAEQFVSWLDMQQGAIN
jgi:hypothetical protein